MANSPNTPFIRPLKDKSAGNPNLRHLQGKEPKNIFEAVTLAVQVINSAVIQPLRKEVTKFSFDFGEWVAKLGFGGKNFSPIKNDIIEQSFKNAQLVASAAIGPLMFIKERIDDANASKQADKQKESNVQNGLFIIHADPKNLSAEQMEWRGYVERLAQKNKQTPEEVVAFIAIQNRNYANAMG